MPTQFNFTYEPGVSLQQMVGIEMAGKIWSSYLQDNATVNIHVGMSSSLPTGVIGGALPGMRAAQSYRSVYNGLVSDKKSANDQTAVSSLQSGDRFRAHYDMFVNGTNQGGSTDTSTVNLTRANAKSLNLLSTSDTSLDGFILLGTLAGTTAQWNYDYSRTSAIASTSLDFLSTVTHEIGHALGFVSGIDKPGWLANTVSAGTSSMDNYITNVRNNLASATPLDFFRYSTKSRDQGFANFSFGSQGGNKYFSLNKGQTSLASFSTGLDTSMGGDGEQASHWKNGTSALMSPTLAKGQRLNVSSLDLTSLDVIGWDVSNVTINFATLQDTAKISLAAKVNPTLATSQRLTWMNSTLSNATSATQAAQQLSLSRTTDIQTMIQNSQIYNWGGGGDGWWQKVTGLFQERGLFSSLSQEDIVAPSPTPRLNNLTIQFGQDDRNFGSPIVPVRSMKLEIELESGPKVQSVAVNVMELRHDRFDLNIPRSFSIESDDRPGYRFTQPSQPQPAPKPKGQINWD